MWGHSTNSADVGGSGYAPYKMWPCRVFKFDESKKTIDVYFEESDEEGQYHLIDDFSLLVSASDTSVVLRVVLQCYFILTQWNFVAVVSTRC